MNILRETTSIVRELAESGTGVTQDTERSTQDTFVGQNRTLTPVENNRKILKLICERVSAQLTDLTNPHTGG